MIIHRKFKTILSIFIFFIFINAPSFTEILFDTQKTEDGWIIEISNTSEETYEAMVISADPDYRPEAGQLLIKPGENQIFRILKTDETEQSENPIYIRLISDHRENPGLITLEESGTTTTKSSENNNSEGVVLEYYYTPTCSICREFLEIEIPLLEEKLNQKINLDNIDITTGTGLIQMNKRLGALGSSEKKLPLLIAGNIILAGDTEIKENMEDVVLKISSGEIKAEIIPLNPTGRDLNLKLLPILLAGLLDGINPCAFSTLIFLLSWLTLAGRNKKEILITGIFFSSAVFFTYYTVGLGAFAALRTSESVPIVSSILKYSMALLLVVLGIIHIFDYRKVRQGRAGEMTLQLSRERKKKIHSLIRGKARQAGLFAGSLALGVLVTIYELGCTGQVYLPTLMYMVRIEKVMSSYFLLGIYNIGFIFPLAIVFIAAWRGIGSDRLVHWFKENLAAVKLLSALFFLLMAALLIIF